MRYDFVPPTGWTRHPFPPPGRGIYLRAPQQRGAGKAAPDAASILLFDAVLPEGTMEKQLEAFVTRGCEGTKSAKPGRPQAVQAGSLPALRTDVTCQVVVDGKTMEETRCFVLVDAGQHRLPLTYLATSKAPSTFAQAFTALLSTIAPLSPMAPPYTAYLE
jgi:hypothetical protein